MSVNRKLEAHNLVGVSWMENGMRFEYPSPKSTYGVRRSDGMWLSFDGVKPYAPSGGRKTAIEVAETIIVDDSIFWVSSK
ncbi:hypothetical protein [Segniliparus rugosus]|uniref:Uncharacterized protein n=1 Tax=Segniliparus rugosus (strain ATCC BAA-974 / DSM 45345 / CCUG 50838 / CIP 108380 / JCM 13579 / CDC 945) TaxID=679197 RepID=U1M2G3_SEGRC|nr:hypothetical protein [Segniliparus rugosus]ERG69290.1 hypothetical protein HMPREF9336_04181 [Segniliparus rugosus ATCC BAA-974]